MAKCFGLFGASLRAALHTSISGSTGREESVELAADGSGDVIHIIQALLVENDEPDDDERSADTSRSGDSVSETRMRRPSFRIRSVS